MNSNATTESNYLIVLSPIIDIQVMAAADMT